MDWTTAWGTVFTGLIVVFIALCLLILLVWGMGKIMESAGGNKRKAAPAPAPKPAPRAPAVSAAPKEAPTVSVGENMDDEVAAAITAALAVILAEEGSDKSYVVRSIRRVRSGSSAWSRAGLAENVRPF